MIYIFTALYHEAHGLISHYGLKKDPQSTRFQVFTNEENGVCLAITGAGEIAAATAVGSICTGYGAGEGDFLVNLGTCAAVGGMQGNVRGQIFLCHKLTEAETGRTFYPDILYRHAFPEAEIVTGRKLLHASNTERTFGSGAVLYDMEAAAVYQAGAYFFAPHRMSFLKVVSDAGEAGEVSAEQIGRLMEENREQVVSYIDMLRRAGEAEQKNGRKDADCDFAEGTGQPDRADQSADQDFLEKLCADLHCSAAMRSSVRQYFRYCRLSGIDFAAAAGSMYEDGRLPCQDKREGKERFEELKRKLI